MLYHSNGRKCFYFWKLLSNIWKSFRKGDEKIFVININILNCRMNQLFLFFTVEKMLMQWNILCHYQYNILFLTVSINKINFLIQAYTFLFMHSHILETKNFTQNIPVKCFYWIRFIYSNFKPKKNIFSKLTTKAFQNEIYQELRICIYLKFIYAHTEREK